jgi:type III restriction enzyme
MPQAVIENPVLNSPYEEPKRHFYFDEDGITDKVVESRRLSSYFVPIAKPKKKGKQLELDTEWTKDRIEENKFINDIRRTVSRWRLSNYDGVTTATRQLSELLAAAGPRKAALLLPDRSPGNGDLSGGGG